MLSTCIYFSNKSYKGGDSLCGWLLNIWLNCSQQKNESD